VKRTSAITHVAMSVPAGTLTDAYRAEVLAFYGEVFGWREMDKFRRDDRLTIGVARGAYINLRERADYATISYEHFGVLVESTEALDAVRDDLTQRGIAVEDSPESELIRFKHLLPMAIEVQYFDAG
jgi:catechol-2,3-dioxygenase